MAVFPRFFQVACSLAALLAALLLVIPPGDHDRPATWPVYLAGSIVLGLEAFRPTLLKGRLAWIILAVVTLAGTGCALIFGYPYPWVLKREETIYSAELYSLGLDLLFWVCAAAATIGLIMGIRHLIAQSRLPSRPVP